MYAAADTLHAQAKLKVIADLVWSKLTAGFSKDLQHAQVNVCCSQMIAVILCPCSTADRLSCVTVGEV